MRTVARLDHYDLPAFVSSSFHQHRLPCANADRRSRFSQRCALRYRQQITAAAREGSDGDDVFPRLQRASELFNDGLILRRSGNHNQIAVCIFLPIRK